MSCRKDWLDAKSEKTQAVASTLSDFQQLLDNTSAMNYFTPALGEIASDGHYVTDASWYGASSNKARNAYTWSHIFSYTQVTDWQEVYPKVFLSNLVLDGLGKADISSVSGQRELNDIKGQALFYRADAFYDLAQIWAPQYDSTTAEKDLSIPLRLTSDITIPSVHSNVKQTYEQIILDLQQAQVLLPVKSLYLTRPSQVATFALLARVYLNIGEYDSAFTYADKCLHLNGYLIDFNTLDTTASSVGLFNREVLFHNVLYTSGNSSFLTANCLIDTALYNLYDPNDLRRSVFFGINADSSISFKGNYNNTSNSQLFCGLATDEIYLIRAECSARKGNVVGAMDDLNTLLGSRWKACCSVTFTATDPNDALRQILIERKKELLMRGIRWTDLRRLNKDSRFAMTLSRTIGGHSYTVSPNNFNYTFPIPDDIIQITGMQQNPGW